MAPLMAADTSFLLAVDLQERLVPAIAEREPLLHRAKALLQAARLLGIPRFFTEHCADRIGPTRADLGEAAGEATVIRKVRFAATAESGVCERFKKLGRPQAIIFGTEAHVCVLQTAIGLVSEGFEVFLVTDATGSRHRHDLTSAIDRAGTVGITAVTTEMVLFEWLARGDSDEFRRVLPTIRDLP